MSNFDKLVQARIDKTGESWATAARNVRAQVHAPAPSPPVAPSPPNTTSPDFSFHSERDGFYSEG